MHPRSRISPMCALALGLFGCKPQPAGEDDSSGGSGGASGETGGASDSGPEPTSSESGEPPPDDGGVRPRETEWQTVVDALPFPAEVKTLSVGRLEFNGNFANRGDITVLFDQDTPVISVEMRVFDFTDAQTFLGDEIGTARRFRLWAFNTPGNPERPSQIDPADDCTQGAWKSGCTISAYYDGQSQPVRAGIDLRVHLPRSYRGELDVTTEDSLAEPTYPRLGDIVIDGVCGSGRVSFAQGTADVKLCAALTPTPTCPADQVAECEQFTDMGQDAAWSPLCPCPPELFGQLLVESRKPWAGDITVDMPDTTWVNVHVANEETDKPHACVPEIENCAGESCVTTEDDMFAAGAEYNYPGPAAPAGAGYNITATAAGCGPVEFFASPDDWVDVDSAPMQAEHGHVRVCTGCL